MNYDQQFIDAIRAAGLNPPTSIIPDGEIHRFSTKGKRDEAGWYVFYDDNTPAGAFGDWRTGLSQNWRADIGRKLSATEEAEHRKRIEEIQRKREAEREQRRIEAKNLANEMLSKATDASGHPYLQAKGIIGYGIKQLDGEILVPMRDTNKEIASLQRIRADGSKLFLSGTSFGDGLYHAIGKLSDTIIICEGYATAASLHEATGFTTVIAFNAGNLPKVAKLIRSRYSDKTFIIAADDDQWTEGNPGMTAATEAARIIKATIIKPEFTDTSSKPTDFNDLHKLEGIEAVKRCFEPKQELTAQDQPGVPEQYIDTMTFLPDCNDKGRPLATIENVAEICHRLGVTVRYNVISKEEEILIPNESFSSDNQANASLAWLTSWCARFKMPTDKLGDFITYLADRNLYNPVANWIKSKPWDGKSRLQSLFDTISSTDDNLKEILIGRWLISAVAAAFNPNGVSAHGVLVLQGDQYLGKTKWFKSLVPEDLGLVKDGMLLRPDDKDSVKQVCSFWLVELGELDATFRKSDIAQLKSFITNQSDVLRRAYARKESHFARRTVFFGSVNPKQFLHDATGNRRYWTIEATAIDHSHKIDMQQLWAEVYELYKNGETYYLTPEEMQMLNSHNDDFQVVDPVEDRLSTRLLWDADRSMWEWKTATDVLISIGLDKPTMADCTKASLFIRKRNGNNGRRSNGKNLIYVPPAK